MLQLKNIKKNYVTSSETVEALKDVNISFRKTEFVSILGPSGCGKTTLLNIVGGLDHYTDGDLIISGRSTKSFGDRDWDVYRNHRVGFIFQSYNLIPHQTVLVNVELALTIAGIPKEERTARAKLALDRVGLAGQYNKKPNQLSGGQCQRVAIARALVNDPEILLADEPTGALDTVTSVQIMELIKEISRERLVIMVTHNPELAEEYSTRIVRLLDGRIIEDTNPLTDEDEASESTVAVSVDTEKVFEAEAPVAKKRTEKAKMSFATAFMLSLKNLFTKKGRSTLTAFAGSIGIIGIALILAVSQGMTAYINHVQETTLSAYPLTLEAKTIDLSVLIESLAGAKDKNNHENDKVYKDPIISELVDAMSKIEENENDLGAFKTYLEGELAKEDSILKNSLMGVQYTYNINIPIYTKNQNGDIIKSDKAELFTQMLGEYILGLAQTSGTANSMLGGGNIESSGMSNAIMSSMMGIYLWEELLSGAPDADGNRAYVNDILKEQYDVVEGHWPEAENQVVLVLNQNNELDDLTLYALGLLSEEDIDNIIDSAVNGTPLPESKSEWTYEEILGLTYKTIMPYDCYVEQDGVYVDMSDNKLMLNALYEKAYELEVVGIIRPNEDAETTMLKGSIAYTYALTEHIIKGADESDVVKAQKANPKIDVTTGLPFKDTTGSLTDAQKKEAFLSYVADLSDEEKIEAYITIQCLKAEKQGLEAGVTQAMGMMTDKDTVINQIVEGLKSETNTDPEVIRSYFADMTLDELKSLMRPTIEESVRKEIHKMTKAQVENALSAVPDQMKAGLIDAELATTADEDFATYYDTITEFSIYTYEETLVKIGKVDLENPFTINLFASSFENKDAIVAEIDGYNDSVGEDQKISYTDIMGILMSSITTIINAITYVLIAFVAISLIVSSIMIGVITLISVQERTKEIGILRAIGASKRDVSSMFNAETIIIGLAAGLIGIGVTYLLCIPINIILHALTGIPNLSAYLPIGAAAILVLISVGLTLFSGLIPASSAAKKDPVVALRTE